MRVLTAIGRQSVPPDRFEVVVAVDGSRDGTREALAHLSPPFLLHHIWQEGRGRAAACNAAISVATGRLIVLLDDDMEPVPAWLAGHLAAHRDRAPRGVVGSAPAARDAAAPRVGRYLAARFDRHLAKLAQARQLSFRDVYTGNFSIGRDVLDAVGGFDEAFAVYGNEDGDLALRLAAAGVPVVFEPGAVAIQHQDKDLPAAFADAQAKGQTAVMLAAKHPGAAAELRLGRPGSRRRQAARWTLLATTRLAPGLPSALVRLTGLIQRLDPPGLDRLYDILLDYGYWLGVRSARAAADGRP